MRGIPKWHILHTNMFVLTVTTVITSHATKYERGRERLCNIQEKVFIGPVKNAACGISMGRRFVHIVQPRACA
jgi:hypothetical protein